MSQSPGESRSPPRHVRPSEPFVLLSRGPRRATQGDAGGGRGPHPAFGCHAVSLARCPPSHACTENQDFRDTGYTGRAACPRLGEEPQGIIMYTLDGYLSASWRDLIGGLVAGLEKRMRNTAPKRLRIYRVYGAGPSTS